MLVQISKLLPLSKIYRATRKGGPVALEGLGVYFLGECETEADAVNEAGLLVQAAEAASGVDDFIFSESSFVAKAHASAMVNLPFVVIFISC